jgi:Dyp-type peroxidase family
VERADVQGLVLFGYRQHPRSRFYLLKFAGGRPREWLRRALPDVTSGAEDEAARYRFNLAFSARGLAALGLDAEDLATFQREFVQGMAHPERSRVLGDRHSDDPQRWQWGSGDQQVDALAMLYARTDEALHERAAELEKSLANFGIGSVSEDVSLPDDAREHFGFVTGVSEPHVRGAGRRRKRSEARLATGELVLGYANGYGVLGSVPSAKARRGTREHPFLLPGGLRVHFGHNGSYLVARKLRQDVAGFWQYCWAAARAEGAPDAGARARHIAARLVGRWPNGVPLVEAPDAERALGVSLNDFGFRDRDPDGLRCPFGAHIRRANPRDMLGESAKQAQREANLHRIVRRGRVFGPKLGGSVPQTDDGVERGLFFVALNADLGRQFELIQQTWLNGKSAGLSRESDPLVGTESVDLDGAPVGRSFSVPARPVRQQYEGLPKVVQVRGGEYFFLPGMRALNFLCDGVD